MPQYQLPDGKIILFLGPIEVRIQTNESEERDQKTDFFQALSYMHSTKFINSVGSASLRRSVARSEGEGALKVLNFWKKLLHGLYLCMTSKKKNDWRKKLNNDSWVGGRSLPPHPLPNYALAISDDLGNFLSPYLHHQKCKWHDWNSILMHQRAELNVSIPSVQWPLVDLQ